MTTDDPSGEARRPLTAEQHALVNWTLRTSRGEYPAWRAAQLSGVPRSTLYDWARHAVLVPDFPDRPQAWSFRDLIFARLVAWLRVKGMPRPEVAARLVAIRRELTESPDFDLLRSDGRGLFLGEASEDRWTGQQAMPSVLVFLDEFDLTAQLPMPDLGRSKLWGPNLLTPSRYTYISPRVMGGEPCVDESRIPTGSLFALMSDRGLDAEAIAKLYDELDVRKVDDALQLETRLRRVA